MQVASGLVFLHSESIVHGGIKPTNVIIADDGHPMLMDFGMAPDLRMVERNMTMADSGRENVGYMSPELIEEGNYTESSDVYALASLILEVRRASCRLTVSFTQHSTENRSFRVTRRITSSLTSRP